MRDCKEITILLAICPSCHRGKGFLPQLEVSWNLRLSHVSFLPNLFCCPSFQHAWLLVTPTVLGFLHIHLPPWELSPIWASVMLGLWAEPRLFQPG